MNLYFLVEGASTETKFYPALVKSIFGSSLNQIAKVQDISDYQNSFYVLSGNGYPQIYTHILQNTIEDINQYHDYHYLFVCLDADEMTIEEREQEFAEAYNELVNKKLFLIDSCEIILVVQYRCIESWFLGNKKFFTKNSSNSVMREFHKFYNVSLLDPEKMGFDIGYDNHASYHYSYLKHMIREKRGIYSKHNGKSVCDLNYIQQIKNRCEKDKHIQSFGKLYNKLLEIRDKLPK